MGETLESMAAKNVLDGAWRQAAGQTLSVSQVKAFAFSGLPVSADRQGFYFPDRVADAFVTEAQRVRLPLAKPEDTAPHFTLEQSRGLVLAAMKDFDPALGAKAQAIFDQGFDKAVEDSRKDGFKVDWDQLPASDTPARWRLEQIEPGAGQKMQRSLASDSPASMYGPANPNPYSVIDYQFDGTMDGVVYMAHELGHSLADDQQREHGGAEYRHGGNPEHMNETQAYFVQDILYGYIERHPELEETYPGIRAASKRHLLNEMDGKIKDSVAVVQDRSDITLERLHGRPLGFLSALGLYQQAMKEGDRQSIADALLGRDGPAHIDDVLKAAGVRDLPAFARTTLASVAETPAVAFVKPADGLKRNF